MRYTENGYGQHPDLTGETGERFYYVDGASISDMVYSFGDAATDLFVRRGSGTEAFLESGLVGRKAVFSGDVGQSVYIANGWPEMASAFQSGNFTVSGTVRLTRRDNGPFTKFFGYWGNGTLAAGDPNQVGLFAVGVDDENYITIQSQNTDISTQVWRLSVKYKLYEWYNITVRGKNDGSTWSFEAFVNGVKTDTFTGLSKPTHGDDCVVVMGGTHNNGTNANWCQADIGGIYMIPARVDDTWIKSASRKAFSLQHNRCLGVRVEVDTPLGTIDFKNVNGEDWIKSGKIDEDIDNDVATADIVLFKNADIVSLSPLNEISDFNNTDSGDAFSEALFLNYPIRVYFRKAEESDSTESGVNESKDWMLRFDGIIDRIDFGSDEEISLSCIDKAGELMKSNITGFKNSDLTELVNPKYGTRLYDDLGNKIFDPDSPDPAIAVTHEEAIQQILNDHDNASESAIATKLQSVDSVSIRPQITNSYSPVTLLPEYSGEVAYLRERQVEVQPVLTAINAIAAGAGRRVFYRWDPQGEQYRLTYYEPEREDAPPSMTLDHRSISSVSRGTLSLENIRNDVRIMFKFTDAGLQTPTAIPGLTTDYPDYNFEVFTYNQENPDEEVLAYVRVENTASIDKYGRLFMQIGDDLAEGITQQEEAERLALATLQDLSESDIYYNIETVNTFEFEIDDIVELEPDGVEITTPQRLAVKAVTTSFGRDGVSQSLTMFGKPSIGATRILSFDAGSLGFAGFSFSLLNPFEPVIPLVVQTGLDTLEVDLTESISLVNDDVIVNTASITNINADLTTVESNLSVAQLDITNLQSDTTSLFSADVNLQNQIDALAANEPDKIEDADGDTRIEVEVGTDDDTIRNYVQNVEVAKFDPSGTTLTRAGASGSTIINHSDLNIVLLSTGAGGTGLLTVSQQGVNTGPTTIKTSAYTSLTDSTLTNSALTVESGEIILREVAVSEVRDGTAFIRVEDSHSATGLNHVTFNLGGSNWVFMRDSVGIMVADAALPAYVENSGGRPERILRNATSNQELVRIPCARLQGDGDLFGAVPGTSQIRSEYLCHTISAPHTYSMPSSSNVLGDFCRIINPAASTADLTVEGFVVPPGSFVDVTYDGSQWIKEKDESGSSGGGGGPYTVSQNSPSPGDVTVTDTASGNSFTIDDTAFTFGNSSLQSQITTNSANISTNTADITDLTSARADQYIAVTDWETPLFTDPFKYYVTDTAKDTTEYFQYPFFTEIKDTTSSLTLQFAESGPTSSLGGAYFTAPHSGYYNISSHMNGILSAGAITFPNATVETLLAISKYLRFHIVKGGTFTRQDSPAPSTGLPAGTTRYDNYKYTVGSGTILKSRQCSIGLQALGSSVYDLYPLATCSLNHTTLLSAGERISIVYEIVAEASDSLGTPSKSTSLAVLDYINTQDYASLEIICVQKT